MHGASSDLKGLPESFEASINERINQESNLLQKDRRTVA